MTIPANQIVAVTPNVISAGGDGIDIIGLVLTQTARVPIGTIEQFPSSLEVADYFGPSSNEASIAAVYFEGFDNSAIKPGKILFAQYNGNGAVAAYLRGGDVAAEGLGYLQAITSGTLSVVVDGYTHSASGINLSGAGSFSVAANLLQSALTATEPTEASFTASIGATGTASVGGSMATCTTSGTTLTIGTVGSGSIWPGDLVSGTDLTNSLPAGCYVVAQLTGTPGGSTGATYQLSAAATPGNMSSATVTVTSTVLDATAVTGLISVGDTITGSGLTTATVSAILTGTGGIGTYQLSGAAQGFASGAIVAASNVLDVTVCSVHTIAVGQTIVGSGVTGAPVITAQLPGGTLGGPGTYTFSGTQQHHASESMTSAATPPTVTYDSIGGAFVVTSGITGTPSTAAFATGSLAATLFLTSALGAVLSQGAAPTTPSAFMDGILGITTDWATFMMAFDPDNGSGNTQKLAFAEWTSLQDDKFAYVCWDTDITATNSVPATASMGQALAANDYSGTTLWWQPDSPNQLLAAFICGSAASIDFTQTNGRITFAFKGQAGFTPTVTDAAVAQNLISNNYNFYGAYATATTDFEWGYPGSISGPFLWLDSYINQIWLNANFQLALMQLLGSVKSIPYNAAGYLLIEAACQDVIDAGLNFGAFRAGVTLSNSQRAQVNSAAGGINIADTLSQRGWYLLVQDASPSTRAQRKSPPCTFFYMDGQAVQSIDLTSTDVE